MQVRRKEQLAQEQIKRLEHELHKRGSKHEDQVARLMAESSQAQARELQAMAKLQEANQEIASLMTQKMSTNRDRSGSFVVQDTKEHPLEDSTDALRLHIAGALSAGQISG